MKKQMINRIILYIAGLLILALGLTLNTKAGLGVSPIISVSFSISEIAGWNFGNTTMGLYSVFVVAENILHCIRQRQYEKKSDKALQHANKVDRKLILFMDIMQILLSIVFTRFLNIFSSVIPDIQSVVSSEKAEMAVRFIVLVAALVLTGIGAAMSLNMRIVPNPGDGIVQAISDCIHKSVGFTKNCFDIFNVTVTVIISLIFTGQLHGVGIGTVLAVIGVGRTIALFNHLARADMIKLAGIEE